MRWERARRPEQKAVRREAILSAARTLFCELEYEEISLNGIAREAAISKPNIYRYFTTREEIFLTIFQQEQDHFVRSLIDRIKRIRSKDPIRAISRAWVEVALEHQTLLDLLPQLCTSMERNSSADQIVHFKKVGYERFTNLVETLERADPRLSTKAWGKVVQCAFSLMSGLWPLSNPGENVLKAMRHPDVDQSPWEFAPLMTQGLSALIRGTCSAKDT